MDARNFHLHGGKAGSALAVRIIPRSRQNEIAEILSDGTIKIHLTPPSTGAKANEVLLEFLAEVLKIPAAKVEIVAGMDGTDKLVSVLDLDSETVHQRVLSRMP
jgi:uncharacterized protein